MYKYMSINDLFELTEKFNYFAVVDGGDKLLRNQPTIPMASAMGDDLSLRDLTHPALNDCLKTHNAATFKLVKTGRIQ